jgi:hypothetical protein
LTTVNVYNDYGWHEESSEDVADHNRAGVARMLRRAHLQIATARTGRASRAEGLEPVWRPSVRGARPHASLRLPLGGILPDALVKKLDGTPSEMRFDHTSHGAQIGSVGPDRLELSADGWDISIETDGQGRITSATRLVFNLGLGGRQVKLSCRPADPGRGHLYTTTHAGSNDLDGRFLLEVATCENAGSGQRTNWPPAPLTVSGSFAGLPPRRR